MPDLVVMTHKTLPVDPVAVPEESVAGYEFYGWKRANKSMQADADSIAAQAVPAPTADSKEG